MVLTNMGYYSVVVFSQGLDVMHSSFKCSLAMPTSKCVHGIKWTPIFECLCVLERGNYYRI
jgi:hypothetical protein